MKVAVFSTKAYERPYFDECNATAGHQLVYFEASLNSDTVNLAQGFDAVCLFVNDTANAAVITQLAAGGVRLIDLRSAGFNHVDIAAAVAKGITVLRVPAYSPQAVAEHALALIMTLNRKTNKAYNRVRENNFSVDNLMGFNLYGKTVGVIGTGKIGAAFCQIMLGIGCQVVAHDIVENAALQTKGVTYLPLEELLPIADIVSLHCPLTPATYHLFNAKAFAALKPGAMLINTGRGALIDTGAAISALKSGRLGYLGMDVYEQEENLFFKDLSASIMQDDTIARLMTFNNVLVTPHLAFFTHEALNEIAHTTIQNFTDFENGHFTANEVKLSHIAK